VKRGSNLPARPEDTSIGELGGRPYIEYPAMPEVDYGRPVRLGLWLLVLGFGGFLAWAALAPLDEGVPASAVVSVESKRKRIDHFTGGIIEKILVREGERVREGQELIVLNESQARASLNAVLSQWRAAAATKARLAAEQQGLKTIPFPKELARAAGAEPEVASILRAQEELFRSRRTALEGELRIIHESVRGLELQVKSLEQVGSGREKQVQLFQEQLSSFRSLNRGGFVSRNQLLELERQLTEVQSKQSEDLANIASINARLADFRMRGAQRQIEYRREVEAQLTDVQREEATLGERLAALRDTHTRLVIRAPVSGTVVDLAFHTVDGVVKPGDRIMDIVPAGDDLIIEAQVAPQYVDRLRAGLPANVHFDAYMSRAERPVVQGTVAVISADALTDPRTGAAYYAMRVAVPSEELQKLGELKLQPGMQATVMVKTGERTLLVYLARPLLRRFSGALSET
jgi:membrane fusion protein, protease secretion system